MVGDCFLTTTKAGTAVWRAKYRFGGHERVYSIGTYPGITLDEARAAREAVKMHLREGRDPTQVRRLSRAAAEASAHTTFGAVTANWLAHGGAIGAQGISRRAAKHSIGMCFQFSETFR